MFQALKDRVLDPIVRKAFERNIDRTPIIKWQVVCGDQH